MALETLSISAGNMVRLPWFMASSTATLRKLSYQSHRLQ
jgi:hypothetical protein